MKYRAKNSDTAEIKFYGVISQWWISSDDYTNTLEQIQREGFKNLEIRTHCYGGSVFEGNAIWVANRRSPLNIDFYIDGIAASMMAILMLSGRNVFMASVAKVMIHPPRGVAEGQAKDHFASAKLLKSMESDFTKELMRKTGKPATEVAKMLDGADNWYSADECVSMKLATSIYDATEFKSDSNGTPDAGTPVEKVFSQYVAIGEQPTPNNSPTNTKKTMDKQALITKFGLTGVTAESSDTAITDAIAKVMEGKDQQILTLETSQKGAVETQANALIAAKEGELKSKFTDEQKTGFLAVAKSAGVSVLMIVLAAMKAVPDITSLIVGEGKESGIIAGRDKWTWDDYQEKDPKALEQMEATNKPAFENLFNAKYKV